MNKIIIILLLILTSATAWSQQRKKTSGNKTKQHTTASKKQAKKTPSKKSSSKKESSKKTSKHTVSPKQKQGTQRKAEVKTEVEDQLPSADQEKTVTITSAYTPSLQNTGSKVNFTASVPVTKIEAPELEYNIPSQNLFFNYQASPIKPVALTPANLENAWKNQAYIKAGFGNYSTPYLQGAISYGNGTNRMYSASISHIQSKGDLPYQQYSKSNINGKALLDIKNFEWKNELDFEYNTHYGYGFQPSTLDVKKEDIKFASKAAEFTSGIKSKETFYGINYEVAVHAGYFGDNKGAHEFTPWFTGNISKNLSKEVSFNLGARLSLNAYKSNDIKLTSRLASLSPAFKYVGSYFNVTAGVTPTQTNGKTSVLPNITANATIPETKINVEAGWIGYYNEMTYQSLISKCSWVRQPLTLFNTKMNEIYGGIKTSPVNHLMLSGKVSLIKAHNFALFTNDTITGRTFDILKESQLDIFRLHGEASYTIKENMSFITGFTFNQYSNLQDNTKAWQMLPLEVSGTFSWQVIKDFTFKADAYYWTGAKCRDRLKNEIKLNGAVDLNAGVEYKIIPRLNIWAQFNNLLNNKYQRWNQYEVLGLNALVGAAYYFNEPSKN